jgi:drug/metabolite transporter (DMT)-like permease
VPLASLCDRDSPAACPNNKPHVCRSAIPVATALLAVGIEGKTPTSKEFGALLVLTSGVMISVWEGLHGSVLGIVFACSSECVASLVMGCTICCPC